MKNIKTHLTAITRNKISSPTKYLLDKNLLADFPILDFGCGKGFDANYLSIDKYDPYFFPIFPEKKYKTILCNYVLNVLEDDTVLEVISNLLVNGGKAYISVRRDLKKEGYTSKGTYQRNVFLQLPIIFQNHSFCIYLLDKITY